MQQVFIVPHKSACWPCCYWSQKKKKNYEEWGWDGLKQWHNHTKFCENWLTDSKTEMVGRGAATAQ